MPLYSPGGSTCSGARGRRLMCLEALVKPLRKARALRDGSVFPFVCSFIRSFVRLSSTRTNDDGDYRVGHSDRTDLLLIYKLRHMEML